MEFLPKICFWCFRTPVTEKRPKHVLKQSQGGERVRRWVGGSEIQQMGGSVDFFLRPLVTRSLVFTWFLISVSTSRQGDIKRFLWVF
jgi:hypothetical protein